MSDVKEMGFLDSMKAQHAQFMIQREQAQINFQQLTGAIFAIETMIKQHEDKLISALKEHAEGHTLDDVEKENDEMSQSEMNAEEDDIDSDINEQTEGETQN